MIEINLINNKEIKGRFTDNTTGHRYLKIVLKGILSETFGLNGDFVDVWYKNNIGKIAETQDINNFRYKIN